MGERGALHAVLFPATPERRLVDAQYPGRLLQRSGRRQNAADVLLLDLLEAYQVSAGGSRLRAGAGPGKNSTPIRSDRQRMEARSTTLRNSRRLPGHACRFIACIASSVKPAKRRWWLLP